MYSLYVNKDIPSNYKYIRVGNNYYDLFPKSSGHNETLDYYRVYFNISPDLYTHNSQTFSNYTTEYFNEVSTNNNILARTDCDKIFVCVFIALLGCLYTINLFTSFFKKGGIAGGLF